MSEQFFSEKNEAMLQRLLYKDICRRTGSDLSEKEATRLIKTVKHYMGEVSRVNGNQTIAVLNKEVLTTTISDYMMYLERSGSSMTRTVAVEKIDQGNGFPTQQTQMYAIENVPANLERGQTDVSNLFSRLQNERMETGKKQPTPPDFRLALSEEGPVSMDTFQRIKEEREQEAARANAFLQQYQEKTKTKQAQGQARFAEAGSSYSEEKKRKEEEAEQAFAETERKRLEASVFNRTGIQNLPVQPDMRELLFGSQPLQRKNESAGNPTIAIPSYTREPSGGLQQMIITPEPSTMAYKETELNLFLYSGDRDWVNNMNESRYNFTVNFDGGSMPVSMRLNASSIAKFRNIVRIEFIKAIMPAEGVDLVVSKSSASAYDSSLNMNILSFPYIQLRIPELDNNSYGTNEAVNASFGVLQYDANWQTDTTNTTNRGYLAMIPKFLKCQKVYQPTPLSTFQKLSFRFERPDGTLVSTIPDTLNISYIYPTLAVNSTIFTASSAVANTVYKTDPLVDISASSYYWIQTSTYFNRWTVQKGDRILMKNIGFSASPTSFAVSQMSDLLNTLQSDAGVYVVDVGYISGAGPGSSGAVFTDDFNKQGYANAILVRGNFQDPATTGGLLPSYPGNIPDLYVSGKLSHFLTNTSVTTGRVLNLTHQIQVSLRVIVREVDPTGVLRPDNLY